LASRLPGPVTARNEEGAGGGGGGDAEGVWRVEILAVGGESVVFVASGPSSAQEGLAATTFETGVALGSSKAEPLSLEKKG